MAGVNLVSFWPEELKTTLARAVRVRGREAYWQDWPAEYSGDTTGYYEPSEADLAARPYLLTTLSLQFTVSSAALPQPPATPAAVLGAGRQAVDVVMAELNRLVGPILVAGRGGTAATAGRSW